MKNVLQLIYLSKIKSAKNMSKWQSKDLPMALTSLGILLTAFADKIEEWASIPIELILTAIGIIFLIPLFIWFSSWLKNRK